MQRSFLEWECVLNCLQLCCGKRARSTGPGATDGAATGDDLVHVDSARQTRTDGPVQRMESGLASPQPGHVTKGAVQMDPMISVEWYAPHSLPTIVDTLSPQYPFLSAVGSECPSALQAVDFQVRLAFRKARRISKSFESVLSLRLRNSEDGRIRDRPIRRDFCSACLPN